MITVCPLCGCTILDPTYTVRSHQSRLDCLRALLLEENNRHKMIVRVMTLVIEENEQKADA